MMIKLLYGIGILAIVSSGVSFALCGMQWRPEGHDDIVPAVSILEATHAQRRSDANRERDVTPPLVAQAAAFALYLNPPQPPPSPQASRPPVNPPRPIPRPVVATPQFRLLLTSCHHSHPDRSLALIAEPGRGDHWIRQGDRVGHLVVEGIKDGGIVCRDGGRLHEVRVALKQTAPLAQLKPDVSVAIRSAGPHIRPVNAMLQSTRGAGTPPVQPVAEREPDPRKAKDDPRAQGSQPEPPPPPAGMEG